MKLWNARWSCWELFKGIAGDGQGYDMGDDGHDDDTDEL